MGWQFRRRLTQDGIAFIYPGSARKGTRAGQHLVEDHAQAEDVGGVAGGFAQDLFRCEIDRRAGEFGGFLGPVWARDGKELAFTSDRTEGCKMSIDSL